ncbi:MAG TPA: allantoate amidohydrolase [Actinomycetes bacterium]|nr:allantoate amidohydrolase [Actinomycetes bacterium]
MSAAEGVLDLLAALAPVGRDARTGGYDRPGFGTAERECREWFLDEARRRDLQVERDGNGNLVAWWRTGPPAVGGVVTGSHLDSVPQGGAFDGPLGVTSALAAVDVLRERGATPRRPLGVAVFAEEEGSRFGLACLGSRLLSGALPPARLRDLRDRDGRTAADALAELDLPAPPGPADLLQTPSAFVELHVEQGRDLVDRGAAVAVATAIRPHGRWRLDLPGRADHAGTTALADRDDPMLHLADAVLAARQEAEAAAALATVGRVHVEPNATNAIPSLVRAWLDVRGADETSVRAVVTGVGAAAGVEPVEESWSPETRFPEQLRERLAATLGGVPRIPTGAGHDAGVLAAAGVPAAMIFVRNPSGVSHSPVEHAEPGDCVSGVLALADVLEELACR